MKQPNSISAKSIIPLTPKAKAKLVAIAKKLNGIDPFHEKNEEAKKHLKNLKKLPR